MWQHIPASDRSFNLSGQIVQLRRGSTVVGTATITPHTNNRHLIVVKNTKGEEVERRTLLGTDVGNLRMFCSNFYGASVYFWKETVNNLKTLSSKEDSINGFTKKPPVSEPTIAPNTLVLVSKFFTKLVDGLRLVMVPYRDNLNSGEFTAVVSRHTMTNSPNRPEVIQVHIQRDDKPYTSISFTTDLDNKTLADIPFFSKHSAYLVKNYVKETKTEVRKSTTERTDKLVTANDDDGKYIIWCPTSDRAPQKIINGQAQAKAVAASMSEKHGKVFYWARLMGIAKQVNKEVVTIKRITETVTL